MPEMNPKKINNGRDVVRPYIPVLVAIVSTFGLTVSGNYLLVRDIAPELMAPDRFTGEEGKILERRLDAIEIGVTQLRGEMDLLPPRELTDRILKLEGSLEQLRIDVNRMHSAK